MNDFNDSFLDQNMDVASIESAPSAIESIVNESRDETLASSVEEATDSPQAAEPAGPNPFEELGLSAALLKAIAGLGYTQPTAVQARVLPLAMVASAVEGQEQAAQIINDLMVSSQTGSGKTAAFLLPILHRLDIEQRERERQESLAWSKKLAEAAAAGEEMPKKPRRKNPIDPRNFKAATPKALILCPTRELAQQVANDAIDLARHMTGVRVANVIGGLPYQIQIAKLQNADLVVATPGRLLDLQRNGQIKCEGVKCLVLDEADRMLDLGFSDDLAAIHQLTEKREQTMMFSATFAARIQQLATRVMRDNGKAAQRITIDSPQEKHANITQKLFWADNLVHKRKLLDHWMRETSIVQAIVFASTQIECDALAQDLIDSGFDAAALHGALSQGLRNRRLKALRDGHIQFLVATDVAARGIDVPSISHVFNYGLPMKAEDYTHRIGRTGRAGRDGMAVTFAEPRDRFRIRDIEDYTRQQFRPDVIPGLEPTERVREKKPFGKSFGKPAGRGFSDRGGDRGGFGGDRGGRSFGGERSNERFNDRGGDRGGFADRNAGGGFGGGFNDRGSDRGFADRNAGGGFSSGFEGKKSSGAFNTYGKFEGRGAKSGAGGFGSATGQPYRKEGGFNDRFSGSADRGGDRGGFAGKSGGSFAPRVDGFGSAPKFAGSPGKSFAKPAGDFKAGKPAPKTFAKAGFKPAGKPAGKTFASKAPRKA
ncbi:MAG: DEAD/DEAH box helicase [Brachymonas sp.]|nr:DEAD/DEAH box helicase [Brachymonas sp.]